MPIAPITGMLRKRFLVDVSTALGLGVAGGYAFWYVLLFCEQNDTTNTPIPGTVCI